MTGVVLDFPGDFLLKSVCPRHYGYRRRDAPLRLAGSSWGSVSWWHRNVKTFDLDIWIIGDHTLDDADRPSATAAICVTTRRSHCVRNMGRSQNTISTPLSGSVSRNLVSCAVELAGNVLLVFGAPCPLQSPAGQEHGRTIPLPEAEPVWRAAT